MRHFKSCEGKVFRRADGRRGPGQAARAMIAPATANRVPRPKTPSKSCGPSLNRGCRRTVGRPSFRPSQLGRTVGRNLGRPTFLAPFSHIRCTSPLFAMVTAAWLRSCVAEALPTTFPPIISVKLLRPTHMYITDQQPEVRRDVWLKSFEESPRNMAVVWAKERRCPPMPTLRRLPRKVFLQSKQRE